MSPVRFMAPLVLAAGWCAAGAGAQVALPVEEQAAASDVAPSLSPGIELSGQLRTTWLDRRAAALGPVAQANARLPGVAAAEPSAATLQAEWRAATRTGAGAGGLGLHASGTVQHRHTQGGSGHSTGWLNEAVVSGSFAAFAAHLPGDGEAPGAGAGSGQGRGSSAWQWSVGKKVVSWDVGYAFRPNDVVQQEARRGLVPSALTGRPLLMAEHFDADTAWSLVWVNPTQGKALDDIAHSPDEAALAARVYHRAGAADWHGFARWGRRTGASVGAAVSWVASDALELHASVRHFAHADALQAADTASNAPASTALMARNPWQPVLTGAGQQWLVGGTWTGESQISLLAEAWYDGAALSKAQWAQWAARNQRLPLWADGGAPARAVAGNLAWQASAFSAASTGSLHRHNVYARLSWTHEGWQPALDVLFHPADRGRIVTASLTWQGDRVKLEGGLRVNAGPPSAVVRQLPVRRQAYLSGTWAF